MSDQNLMEKFWGKVEASDTDKCWPWKGGLFASGYGLFWHRGKAKRASRVACMLAHGKPSKKSMHACHSCHRRDCVNPRHLRWDTAKNNNRDKRDAGSFKLSWEDVAKIRQATGTQKEIGEIYGITQSMVSYIKSGRHWDK